MLRLLLIPIILILIPLTSHAVSLNDIHNNPNQYTLVYSDEKIEEYVDTNSIKAIRYAPPYYVINANTLLVSYQHNIIMQTDETFFYNYDNNIRTLLKSGMSKQELANRINMDTGLKYKVNSTSAFNFDGSSFMPTEILHQEPEIPGFLSPVYHSAMFAFYKTYNLYFNPKAPKQPY